MFADEVRIFNGKRYKVKGIHGIRISKQPKQVKHENDWDALTLNQLIYEAKTVYNNKYGVIAKRKAKSKVMKCIKSIVA